MTEIGKIIALLGVLLVIAGIVVMLFGRMNLPLGRLPGDMVYRGKHTVFYFPLVTSILISILLSLVLYGLGKIRR